MPRPPLQDCQKCGGRHYGPATKTNCPKFASGSQTISGGTATSGLATKSVLAGVPSTADLDKVGKGVDLAKVPREVQAKLSEPGFSLVADSDGEPLLREAQEFEDGETVYYSDMNGETHRTGAPAITRRRNKDGFSITSESWLQHGTLHREDGPALLAENSDGCLDEQWHRNGELHRTDGEPAVTKIVPPKQPGDAPTQVRQWFRDGMQARPKGQSHQPSAQFVNPNGTSRNEWTSVFVNKSTGERYVRQDRPASAGPATETFDRDGNRIGYEYKNAGRIHRLDGPARLHNGKEQYFLNNKFADEEDWRRWNRFADEVGRTEAAAAEFSRHRL